MKLNSPLIPFVILAGLLAFIVYAQRPYEKWGLEPVSAMNGTCRIWHKRHGWFGDTLSESGVVTLEQGELYLKYRQSAASESDRVLLDEAWRLLTITNQYEAMVEYVKRYGPITNEDGSTLTFYPNDSTNKDDSK